MYAVGAQCVRQCCGRACQRALQSATTSHQRALYSVTTATHTNTDRLQGHQSPSPHRLFVAHLGLGHGTSALLHRGAGFTRPHTVVSSSLLARRYNSTQAGGHGTQAPGSHSATHTQDPASTPLPEGYIPEPPVAPTDALPLDDLVTSLASVAEPTLSSLGLCAYNPAGVVQMCLEHLHMGAGIPWFASIMLMTLGIRICLFPLVILGQKNVAKTANHMPVVQKLQQELSQARRSGNTQATARKAMELQDYMKRNDFNPLKNILPTLAQIPVFLSVFAGIRGMANLPVESMKTGGILWFTDLTICDPIYLLPLITATTLFVTLEFGTDAARTGSMTPGAKMFMRIMPFAILPFTINFPAAMLCYWFSANIISLVQVSFLRQPKVRDYFKIQPLAKHEAAHPKTKAKKKGFIKGFKENYDNNILMAQIEKRQQFDSVKFKEAGMAPIQKTYSYDPTKVKQGQEVKVAKKNT